MKKEKSFDAVAFMRKRRDELSKLHLENPAEYKRQLELIRKKYREKFPIKGQG
ncbi:MAG: hypothetical protein WD077_02040 [Bacteroidia bacterium]